MSDNIVNVSFKQKSDADTLIESVKELQLDSLVFVGRKDEMIFAGSTSFDDISPVLGDLYLAQKYIADGGV